MAVSATIRRRYAALAVRTEASSGTFAFTTNGADVAAADLIGGEIDIRYNQSQVTWNEANGSLDQPPGLLGTITAALTIRMPLRGNTTAGMVSGPEWGRLLECATMAKTYTAAAIGTPTAATAGAANAITLAAPFSTIASAYVGMPMNLSGDISNKMAACTGYTASRVATIGNGIGAIPTTATLVQIPSNNLWAPTSDDASMKSCSIIAYVDGLQWTFRGATGSWRVEMQAGALAYIVFDLVAMPASDTLGSVIADYASSAGAITDAMVQAALAVRTTPLRFADAIVEFDRVAMQVRNASVSCTVSTVFTDNPASQFAIDPATVTGRTIEVQADPLMRSSNGHAAWTRMVQGVSAPLVIKFGGIVGGTRVMVTLPAARVLSMTPGERDQLGADTIRFQADGVNSGVFLCCW